MNGTQADVIGRRTRPEIAMDFRSTTSQIGYVRMKSMKRFLLISKAKLYYIPEANLTVLHIYKIDSHSISTRLYVNIQMLKIQTRISGLFNKCIFAFVNIMWRHSIKYLIIMLIDKSIIIWLSAYLR